MTSDNLLLNLFAGWKYEKKLIEKIADELFFESYPDELLQRLSPVVETWPFMDSVVPCLWCCGSYLLFVLWLGPLMMKKRKPFKLHLPMLAYNLVQVIFSIFLLFKCLGNRNRRNYVINTIFNPESQVVNVEIEKELTMYNYCYVISKYIELIDTVFFVMRKKQNQVTFLHVYHHTNMAISAWVYLKYIRASHTVFMTSLNLFVHSIMYGYYFLTALGPWVKPYLWWKKYLTVIQLGQFVLVIFYIFLLALNGSTVQKSLIWYSILTCSTFIILFSNFFKKSYYSNRTLNINKKTN